MNKIDLGDDPAVSGTLPLYADIVPLQYERHRDWRLREDEDSYAFAARSPTVPITVDEFERAALDYPIVFFGPARAAYAVTGIAADRNAFVEPDGHYARGRYIPANCAVTPSCSRATDRKSVASSVSTKPPGD